MLFLMQTSLTKELGDWGPGHESEIFSCITLSKFHYYCECQFPCVCVDTQDVSSKSMGMRETGRTTWILRSGSKESIHIANMSLDSAISLLCPDPPGRKHMDTAAFMFQDLRSKIILWQTQRDNLNAYQGKRLDNEWYLWKYDAAI